MNRRDFGEAAETWSRHRWLNRLQTVLLVVTMLGIAALSGSLLFGDMGLWLALAAGGLALLVEPAAASSLTLRLYRARALHPSEVIRPEFHRHSVAALRIAPFELYR